MSETQTDHVDTGPAPLHAEPRATYGIHPPAHTPHAHRPWPLWLRLAIGVLMVGLAAGLVMSLITLRSVSARQSRTDQRVSELSGAIGLNASQTSQDNSQTGGSVASLRSQLGTVEAQLGALAARVSHQGMCLRTATDNTGNVISVTLSPPVMVSGNDACPSGVFVSAVPTRG